MLADPTNKTIAMTTEDDVKTNQPQTVYTSEDDETADLVQQRSNVNSPTRTTSVDVHRPNTSRPEPSRPEPSIHTVHTAVTTPANFESDETPCFDVASDISHSSDTIQDEPCTLNQIMNAIFQLGRDQQEMKQSQHNLKQELGQRFEQNERKTEQNQQSLEKKFDILSVRLEQNKIEMIETMNKLKLEFREANDNQLKVQPENKVQSMEIETEIETTKVTEEIMIMPTKTIEVRNVNAIERESEPQTTEEETDKTLIPMETMTKRKDDTNYEEHYGTEIQPKKILRRTIVIRELQRIIRMTEEDFERKRDQTKDGTTDKKKSLSSTSINYYAALRIQTKKTEWNETMHRRSQTIHRHTQTIYGHYLSTKHEKRYPAKERNHISSTTTNGNGSDKNRWTIGLHHITNNDLVNTDILPNSYQNSDTDSITIPNLTSN